MEKKATSTLMGEDKRRPSWHYFAAGQSAGMAGVLCGQPFDTVKVNRAKEKKKSVNGWLKMSVYR